MSTASVSCSPNPGTGAGKAVAAMVAVCAFEVCAPAVVAERDVAMGWCPGHGRWLSMEVEAAMATLLGLATRGGGELVTDGEL